jgi:hypothetical protein
MDWQRILALIEENAVQEPVTPLEALKQLNESVTSALLACIKEDRADAQEQVAKALPQLLDAMQVLGVDPVLAMRHPPERMHPSKRLIYVEGNRVEVRVDDELRGSWSIWSIADLKEVCRLAEEFDCGLVYSIIGDLEGPKTCLGM